MEALETVFLPHSYQCYASPPSVFPECPGLSPVVFSLLCWCFTHDTYKAKLVVVFRFLQLLLPVRIQSRAGASCASVNQRTQVKGQPELHSKTLNQCSALQKGSDFHLFIKNLVVDPDHLRLFPFMLGIAPRIWVS